MDIFTKCALGISAVLMCALFVLYLYIADLKTQNERLQASNSTLQAALEAKRQEAQKNQEQLLELNAKLNSIRAQARKGEDKLNEALNKSNDKCSTVKLSDDIINQLR
ncbi:MAG: hypothetical protein U0L03_00765 [Succinivibrionaceae bacterium]|nr:hypothetical protein [Succinivibrionaceae bacterium]